VPSLLESILDATRATIPGLRARWRDLEAEASKAPPPRSFRAGLQGPRVGLIAEVKRRSPSAGEIQAGLDPARHAAAYAGAGAAAISVLTNREHFGGSLEDLSAVVRGVPVPVLRKDFILDETQILEARAAGASAILLITRALSPARLKELARAARDWELETLVEVHTASELDLALESGATAIGVNSRDLNDFRIDTEAAWRLVARVPADRVAVAESGMSTPADVERAAQAGADAVLIGTALSAAPDPADLARRLAGIPRRGR
jgi:indole-3-glycerol phosphate synthase